RKAMNVFDLMIERHAIVGVGQHLAEGGYAHGPSAGFLKLLLHLLAEAHFGDQALPALTARAALIAIAADKFLLARGLVAKIAESRNVNAVGPPPDVVAILKAVDVRLRSDQEVMVHDVAAELVAVIAESAREALACRVQHDPGGIERRGAEEN